MAVDVSDIKPGCVVRTDAGCVAVVDGINDEDYVQLLLAGPRADMGIHANHIAEIIAPAQEVDHGDGRMTRVMTLPVEGERKALDQTKSLCLVGTGYTPGCERLTHAEFIANVGPVEREPTAAERELAESDWPLPPPPIEWVASDHGDCWELFSDRPHRPHGTWRPCGTEDGFGDDLPGWWPEVPLDYAGSDSLIELAVVRRLREEASANKAQTA